MNNLRLRGLQLALASTVTTIGGCIAPDATKELNATASLAADRIVIGNELETIWQLPPAADQRDFAIDSPLTLERALLESLTNDPALRRELARITEAKADLSESSFAPNPIVAFGIGISIDGISGAPASAQLMQQLTWLWRRADVLDRDNARLQAAVFAGARIVVEHSASVQTAFAHVLRERDRVTLRQADLATTTRTVSLLSAIARSGELAMLEVDRATIDQRAAQAALALAERSLREAKLNLTATMGRPSAQVNWHVAGALDCSENNTFDEDAIIERALALRLDVAAADERVKAAEATARLAGWSRLPEVGVSLGWQKNFNGREAIAPGASISIPLFNDGSAKRAKAAAALDAVRWDAQLARLSAVREARQHLNAYLRAREQVEHFDNGLVARATQVVHRTERAFQAGTTNATDLLLAQRRLIALQLQSLEQQLATRLAHIALERAIGGSFAIPLETPSTGLEHAS